MTNRFKEEIDQDELTEITFTFSDGTETKISPCYESWNQYGSVMLDPDLLDSIFAILRQQLFKREIEEN